MSAQREAWKLGGHRGFGDEYDVIHASPPCLAHTVARSMWGREYDDLVPATRDALIASGKAWIIENVPGAPMRADYILCGSQFGLRVCRHDGLMAFEHKSERACGSKSKERRTA